MKFRCSMRNLFLFIAVLMLFSLACDSSRSSGSSSGSGGSVLNPGAAPAPESVKPLSGIDVYSEKYAPKMDLTQAHLRYMGLVDYPFHLYTAECQNHYYEEHSVNSSLGSSSWCENFALIGGVQTYNDKDTVTPQLYKDKLGSETSYFGCDLWEVDNGEGNMDHDKEIVGAISFPLYDKQKSKIWDADFKEIGEAGIITVHKNNFNKWIKYKYDKTIADPVVFANIVSRVSRDRRKNAHVRIKDVTSESFYMKLEFWPDSDDEVDYDEEVNYFVIKTGRYRYNGDFRKDPVTGNFDTSNPRYNHYILEVGTKRVDHNFKKIILNTDYTGGPPFIAAMCQTADDNDPVVTRIKDVHIDNSSKGSLSNMDYFQVRLQGKENNEEHGQETVGYLALGAENGPSSMTNSHETIVDKNGWLQIKEFEETVDDSSGGVKVEVPYLCNEKGDKIQLKGMSGFWPNWKDGGRLVNSSVIDWMVDKWGITVYRLPVGVDPKDPKLITGKRMDSSGYIFYRDERYARICQIIDYCIYKGIYVIIDWHIHDGMNVIEYESGEKKSEYYEEGTKYEDIARELFYELAARYHNRPNVIFELWNEPSKLGHVQDASIIDWDPDGDDSDESADEDENDLKGYSLRLINVIRSGEAVGGIINPSPFYPTGRHIIIAPTPCWDQWIDNVGKSPIDKENIMYSFHFYAGSHVVSKEGREFSISVAGKSKLSNGVDRPSVILGDEVSNAGIDQAEVEKFKDNLPQVIIDTVPTPREAMLLFQWTLEPYARLYKVFDPVYVRNPIAIFATEWGTSTYDGGGVFPSELDEAAFGLTRDGHGNVYAEGYVHGNRVPIYDPLAGENINADKITEYRLKAYTESATLWLKFLQEKKISWCNWSVSAKHEGASMLKHKVSDNQGAPAYPNMYGGWLDKELSDSGLYMQKVFKGKIDGIDGNK